MPLTYIQDFCGAITRTVEDQALILNAVAVKDPGEYTQELEGAGWEGKRPTDWSSYLKTDALEGKVIGWESEAWTSPWGDEGTINAMKEEFKYFRAAGAIVVHIEKSAAGARKNLFNVTGDTGYEGWLKWIQNHPNSPYRSPPEITLSQLRIPQLRSAATKYEGEGAMSEASIKGFVEYRQAYQAELKVWMEKEGVDAVVFPGEASTIHLNDSNESSFARETPAGARIDPQASNAGVPTSIFPAGVNPVGQPDNLQLEGPAFSDPEMLGMAYAFENVAHGAQATKFAPALKYSQDSVVAPETLPTAPESTTTPPAGSTTPPGGTTTTTTEKAAKAHLVGDVKFRGGKLLATVACGGSSGTCHVVLEIGLGRSIDMEVAVSVGAGEKKAVKVKLSKSLRKAMKAHPKAKVSLRLVVPEGKAEKVK